MRPAGPSSLRAARRWPGLAFACGVGLASASAWADRPPVPSAVPPGSAAPPPSASAPPSAAPPPSASPPPSITAAAPAPAPRASGAVVVGLGDATVAKALAREIYRESGLKPAIDERMARILAGDAPSGDLSSRERDVRDVRASLEKQLAPESEALLRRGLASLGGDVGAELVVATFGSGKDARARVLRVATARWDGVELVPIEEEGVVGWPRAGRTVSALLTPEPPKPQPFAKKEPDPPKKDDKKRPEFWQSPWFWVGTGVLLAAGVGVLVGSQVAGSESSKIHVVGNVTP